MRVASQRLAEGGSGLGIELAQLLSDDVGLVGGELQGGGNAVPVLFGELVEVALHHPAHQFLEPPLGSSGYLQQQTLLQRAGADARGVERLQTVEHVDELRLVHVDVVVDGQFVAEVAHVLAQQPVVVERADEIFHDVALPIGELQLAHLLLELVIKRGGVAPDNLLIVGVGVAGRGCPQVGRRQFVVAPQVFQCVVKGFFALLALGLLLVLLVGGVGLAVFGQLPFGRGLLLFVPPFFQGRVVVQLGKDVLFQLGQRHLEQLHLEHLLL